MGTASAIGANIADLAELTDRADMPVLDRHAPPLLPDRARIGHGACSWVELPSGCKLLVRATTGRLRQLAGERVRLV